VADLVRSSPLHDIGKVGIPDRILLKPGKLDAREWDIMRTHAELGARTLEEIIVHQENEQTFLEMSMRIAWCHHEKWDGTGYPRNLSGEQIPLEARILAIADVYDALTSRRPYKEPWLHAEAVRWIAEAAGSHFDPRCVRVFVRRNQEVDAVRQRLADTDEDLARLSHRAA
jgi:putative two-component system response regulator